MTRRAFYQCSHDSPTQSLEQFIIKVKAKAQVLRDMGIAIEESEVLDVILMNIHQAFITPTTILLPQTTEPKLSDAIATLTASPAINVDIIKEDTYSSLVSANTALSGRPSGRPD
ncbi:hypothetical protein K525DRAFT_275221 [Schizophyllum commune Loenen D]|nr:hypothetical protein K525DRAFT_275221 [Schizophyllum commune Loenen D]